MSITDILQWLVLGYVSGMLLVSVFMNIRLFKSIERRVSSMENSSKARRPSGR